MARVICPNCGTEFNLGTRSGFVCGDPRPNDNTVVGSLVAAEIRNENMEGNTMATNVINQENTMNGIDMGALAQMVANLVNTQAQAVQAQTETEDKGLWGKTSKYYGKEICGYLWNPYLDRRFVPKQFKDLMANHNRNVDEGIKMEVPYMSAISFMRDELSKLVKLEKKDPIAFDERKRFWSVADVCNIFIDYATKSLDVIAKAKAAITNDGRYTLPGLGYVKCTVKMVPNSATKKYDKTVKTANDWIITDIENIVKKLTNLLANRNASYADVWHIASAMPKVKVPQEYKLQYTYTNGKWNKVYKFNRGGYRLPIAFIEGYKKTGAYYTLKDKIKFENIRFEGTSGREAVDKLRAYLDNGTPAYIIYAKLKDVM